MTDQNTNVPAVQEREKHSLKEVTFERRGNSTSLTPQSMADVTRFAEVMAKGEISLPAHLRGKVGDCLTVTLQAIDWGMNPIAVANKTYSVNNRLAFEAQLIAAVVHSRAPIQGRPRYAYTGEPKTTRQCTVSVTTTDGEPLEYTSPMVKDITVKNSPLWKADEDQQLGYFSIRSLARRYFPELMLGVYDREEVEGMRDVTPRHRETSGLRERLESNRMQGGDKGFSQAAVEEAIDGHFEDSEQIASVSISSGGPGTKTVVTATTATGREIRPQESLDAALGGDDLPDGLKATSVQESGSDIGLEFDITGDPRVIARWIDRFKELGGQMDTASALMNFRTTWMDHIRKIFEVAPQRGEELDAWFGQELKARRAKKET